MGCSGSKQARRDRHRSPSPLRRSISYSVRHPSRRKSESYHIVALTSSTLGSLGLDPLDGEPGPDSDADEPQIKNSIGEVKVRNFSSEINQAKAWSDTIDRKIPKTPTVTPPNEPETINAWELMAGLEEVSPHLRPTGLERSFSFHACREVERETDPKGKPKHKAENKSLSPKPMWLEMSTGDSIVTDLDPEIISTFRRALEELSPVRPFHLRSPEPEKCASKYGNWAQEINGSRATPDLTGIVRARVTDFQQKIDAKKAARSPKAPPGSGKKVVCYHTSLRGVRKTYEDCCHVRVILKGYGVRVDERDVSMDGGFKEELNEILGAGFVGDKLPRVFANGRYLGGAEEVRKMHEDGELGDALAGCEAALTGKGVSGPCDACGDVRFVPCETCHGSCKVYVEDEEEEEEATVIGGFRRCPDCNENGIVRCPICCPS